MQGHTHKPTKTQTGYMDVGWETQPRQLPTSLLNHTVILKTGLHEPNRFAYS